MEPGLSCFLLSLQNKADLLWTAPYNLVMEPFEIPLVKQKAIEVLIVLLTTWGKLAEGDLSHIVLPNWDVVNDLAKLLSNLSWQQKLSDLVQNERLKHKENSKNENGMFFFPFYLIIKPI